MASLSSRSLTVSSIYTQPAADNVDYDFEYTQEALRGAVQLEQARRERQRLRMVHYRRKKKASVAGMALERQRLEEELQTRIAAANNAVAEPLEVTCQGPVDAALQGLCTQRVQLARENMALYQELERYRSLGRVIQRDYVEFLRGIDAQEQVPSSRLTDQGDTSGWRVYFPSKEPSFHFHPLSKDEYEDAVKRNGLAAIEIYPCVASVGQLFGWTVDYAPVTRNEAGTSYIAHAQFSRRVRCTLEHASNTLLTSDTNLWPVVVSPRSWGRVQRGKPHIQVLQAFETDAYVIVCNVPCDVHLRYLAVMKHTRATRPDGKRMDTYSMLIADSAANSRRREAENPQSDVQWVLEGGCFATFTEVDDKWIDIVYDHWAGCISEAHGHELYIDWIQHAVGMEQQVSPTRFLRL